MVSVDMITYIHEKFIAQAIEGVLMQKTSFPFELVIGEDYSTDNTAAIVAEYAQKYPDIIKARCNKKNLGMLINGFKTLQECTGKYIALCEGDDYWTDPLKLQKQVDFLEQHPDYFLCAHRTEKLFEETKEFLDDQKDLFIESGNREISIHNFLNPYILKTNTVLFRNSFDFYNMPQKGFKDIFLFALILDKGKGICLNEIMSIYRVHGGSIWSSKKLIELYKANSETAYHMKRFFKSSYDSVSDFAWITLRGYLEELYRESGAKHELIKTVLRLFRCFYIKFTPWQRKNEISRLFKYLFTYFI
jgi:glycosyltransferase involved in cell wall biosynthesis